MRRFLNPAFGLGSAASVELLRWRSAGSSTTGLSFGKKANSNGFKSLGQGFSKKAAPPPSSTQKSGGTGKSSCASVASSHQEHCLLGWEPRQMYTVVADVGQYGQFLPWCVSAVVDSSDMPPPRCTNMTATLGVGFSFLREKYQSEVSMVPYQSIHARLHGSSTILQELHCEWYFSDPSVEVRQQKKIEPNVPTTEVLFRVHFTFRNPLHQSLSSLVMSNVVTVMTSSFEKRCAHCYGAASHQRLSLPLTVDHDFVTTNTTGTAGSPQTEQGPRESVMGVPLASTLR